MQENSSMRKYVFPKTILMAALIAGLVTLTTNQSNAVTASFDADYEILEPLGIHQNNHLEFGQMVKPSVGGTTNTFTMAPATGVVVVSGAGDGTHAGSQHAGELHVTAGASGLAVAQPLGVTPGSCDDAGVTLTSISFGTATNSGNTNFTIAVGGAITVDGNAANGAGVCEYTVEANFT
jgi:hypothetical protein